MRYFLTEEEESKLKTLDELNSRLEEIYANTPLDGKPNMESLFSEDERKVIEKASAFAEDYFSKHIGTGGEVWELYFRNAEAASMSVRAFEKFCR